MGMREEHAAKINELITGPASKDWEPMTTADFKVSGRVHLPGGPVSDHVTVAKCECDGCKSDGECHRMVGAWCGS